MPNNKKVLQMSALLAAAILPAAQADSDWGDECNDTACQLHALKLSAIITAAIMGGAGLCALGYYTYKKCRNQPERTPLLSGAVASALYSGQAISSRPEASPSREPAATAAV